jgi:hypothetical protein
LLFLLLCSDYLSVAFWFRKKIFPLVHVVGLGCYFYEWSTFCWLSSRCLSFCLKMVYWSYWFWIQTDIVEDTCFRHNV